MCHKISIRERGKPNFTMQTEEYPDAESAFKAGADKITNSGFDAFEIWDRAGVFYVEPAVVQLDGKPLKGVPQAERVVAKSDLADL